MQSLGKRFMLLFHALGVSALAAAISLEALVFTDILSHGYFHAVEGDLLILGVELGVTAYGAVYLVYVLLNLGRSRKKQVLFFRCYFSVRVHKSTEKVMLLLKEMWKSGILHSC
jgi:hypothetical protein